jgi:hypothetical protein
MILYSLDNRLTDGGEVVSLKSRPRFTPRKIFWYAFLSEVEKPPRTFVRLEGLGRLKILITSSGLELATFWRVA